MLEVIKISSGYGKKEVLHSLDLFVNKGEIVVLFGHNGAGKTTTLKTIFGLIKPKVGSINYLDKDISNSKSSENIKNGMVFVPQEENVFSSLSVFDNLDIAFKTINNSKIPEGDLKKIYKIFPILEERKKQKAGTLSGGEQKMLALSMALIIKPEIILLDEPSLGLSPILVKKFIDTIEALNKQEGMTILLVEQNIKPALKIAHRIYVMKMGRIIKECKGKDLNKREDLINLL